MTNKEIASHFSNGDFNLVQGTLSENIEWRVFENNKTLTGKQAVTEFMKSVTHYFKSLETDFKMMGIVEEANKIVIYGQAEFKKNGILTDTVNSCDVYEFNLAGEVDRIYSYCNSYKPGR